MENYITGMDSIAMAAVVAQPHPRWDERPVALADRRGYFNEKTADCPAPLSEVKRIFPPFTATS